MTPQKEAQTLKSFDPISTTSFLKNYMLARGTRGMQEGASCGYYTFS